MPHVNNSPRSAARAPVDEAARLGAADRGGSWPSSSQCAIAPHITAADRLRAQPHLKDQAHDLAPRPKPRPSPAGWGGSCSTPPRPDRLQRHQGRRAGGRPPGRRRLPLHRRRVRDLCVDTARSRRVREYPAFFDTPTPKRASVATEAGAVCASSGERSSPTSSPATHRRTGRSAPPTRCPYGTGPRAERAATARAVRTAAMVKPVIGCTGCHSHEHRDFGAASAEFECSITLLLWTGIARCR